jgi:hypothetical protein
MTRSIRWRDMTAPLASHGAMIRSAMPESPNLLDIVQSRGPVRRIGVQRRSVTGTMPNGNRYESTLERDLMILLEFDRGAKTFTPQPLRLNYTDHLGMSRSYTPDGLVEWNPDAMGNVRAPTLVEVKYREAFIGEWRAWRARLRAARAFAAEHGWTFEVHTDKEIRTPLLHNANLLLPFRRGARNEPVEASLLAALHELGRTSPRDLIRLVASGLDAQASSLPVLWRLLVEGRVAFDRHAPLTMSSALWVV